MSLGVYLYFNGDCREAVTFYAKAFSLEAPVFLTCGEAPAACGRTVTEQNAGLIFHTALTIRGMKVTFADMPPERAFVYGNNTGLVVRCVDKQEAAALFEIFRVKGKIESALQETLWSEICGTILDHFGIRWQFYSTGDSGC